MDPKPEAASKTSAPLISDRKLRGEKITCLTAYDYPTARLLDEAGIDLILVGDSLGQVVLGYESTIPVTVEEMLHHLRAVRRGTQRALLVVDLPYGSYHPSEEEGLRTAIRFFKEGGAEAVKIEGGKKRMGLIRRLVEAEIPVMGHIGLTPQSVRAFGGYRVQGKTIAVTRWPMPKLWRTLAHFLSYWKVFRGNSRPSSPVGCAFPRSASAPGPSATAKSW